jgi:hypothetical protein
MVYEIIYVVINESLIVQTKIYISNIYEISDRFELKIKDKKLYIF